MICNEALGNIISEVNTTNINLDEEGQYLTFSEYEPVLSKIKELNYFIDYRLNNGIIGNVLFLNCNKEIATYILNYLVYKLPDIDINEAIFDRYTREGDVAATATNISEYGILVNINDEFNMNSKALKVLNDAISEHALHVKIGKGPAAREILLELPLFTFILFINKKTNSISKIKDSFEYVIDIGKTDILKDLSYVLVKKSFDNYKYDTEIINYILKVTNSDMKKCCSICSNVCKYIELFSTEDNCITIDVLEHIIKTVGINC